MKTLILLGMMVVGAGAQMNVAIGNHAEVRGSYNVVIGARRAILHGECRMALGRIDWQTRELLMSLHEPPPKYMGGPVPNIGKIEGPTFDVIDKHCGYEPGTISSYVTRAYYTGTALFKGARCSPLGPPDVDGSQHMICWYKPKGAKP